MISFPQYIESKEITPNCYSPCLLCVQLFLESAIKLSKESFGIVALFKS